MNIKQIIFFIFLSFAFLSCNFTSVRNSNNEQKYDYTVKVIGISDGDTFTGLTDDDEQIRFRIYAIDAPERGQAYSNKSKQYLSDLIYGETVGIVVQKKQDGWGRPVVWVYTADRKDVSAEMLKAGMAWHFKNYDSYSEYEKHETKAREEQIGLWQDQRPVAPWEYRESKRKKKN